MTLFKRIKLLSTERGKNIKDIAIELGYGENYFYSFNSGKKPSSDKLEAIADYFDVSTDYLLGRSENKRCDDLKVNNESDLDKKLQRIISGLKDEEKEFLIAALDNTLQLAKSLSKNDRISQ
jgi:transcriptional regulator with XRE-family HTH domain